MNTVLFAQEITELETIINQQKQMMTLLANFDKCATKLVEMKNKLAAVSPEMWAKASAKLNDLLNGSVAAVSEPTIVAEEPAVVAEEPAVVVEEPTVVAEENGSPYQEKVFSPLVKAFVHADDPTKVHCAYLGFKNKTRAEKWANALAKENLVTFVQIRDAQRIPESKYELKMKGITLKRLELLANTKLTEDPNVNIVKALTLVDPVIIPVPAPAAAAAEPEKSISASTFLTTPARISKVVNEVPKVGDWVELLHNGQTYEVVEVGPLVAMLQAGSERKQAYFDEIKIVPLLAEAFQF